MQFDKKSTIVVVSHQPLCNGAFREKLYPFHRIVPNRCTIMIDAF